MAATAPAAARTGRPRDPTVDRRIREAAVEVFAEHGWAGFSIERVARRAGVGKASVYLRWTGREDLLTDAVAAAFVPLREIDTGTLRGDLEALAVALLELYSGRHGLAARRMVVESAATPGVSERWHDVRTAQMAATRALVRRAVERGEVPASAPVGLLLDTLCGAAMLRPVTRPTASRAARDRYARELVEFVLRAAVDA